MNVLRSLQFNEIWSLRCFVIGLSSYDGFYDDLAIFKVKVFEVWEIYVQYHDLTIYLRVKRSDNTYLA